MHGVHDNRMHHAYVLTDIHVLWVFFALYFACICAGRAGLLWRFPRDFRDISSSVTMWCFATEIIHTEELSLDG